MSLFRNREEAADQLAAQLALRFCVSDTENPLILAIPPGGVPIGRVIADELAGELDVVLVHRIASPGDPDLGIGSVSETGEISVSDSVRWAQLPENYIFEEAHRQKVLLCGYRSRYTPGWSPPDPAGRIVVIVADGMVRGTTMLAAVRAVRKAQPSRVIVAAGVAPRDTAKRLATEVDDVVILQLPHKFSSVGDYFQDFRRVSDQDVASSLARGPRLLH
ncbi:MAG: phosphoribosyltransferase family protein [Gammaproteobacteria bacterium]